MVITKSPESTDLRGSCVLNDLFYGTITAPGSVECKVKFMRIQPTLIK